MVSEKYCKVCIVGGGVSGLALARALEILNISYLLLERCHDAAPPTGSSIGLQPNGLRVLDQLGYIEALSPYFVSPTSWNYCDGATGDTYAEVTAVQDFEKIFGYGIYCVKRQLLLQVMYEGIQDKSRILFSKKVTDIQNLHDKAIVATTDGSRYSFDIVAGTDGVHSIARKEIETLKGVSPLPEYLATRHDCAFGISGPVEGIDAGQFLCALNDRVSVLTLTGLGNELYWFAFRDLGEDVMYRKTRNYTEEDADQLCEECLELHLNSKVTFKELYGNRKRVQMFLLEEGVSSNWHAGRMVLMGDSCHKLTPHSGMGGNIALESVASFVNHIRPIIENDGCISQELLHDLLIKYSSERYESAQKACQISAERCRAAVSGEAAKAMRHVMPNFTQAQWLKVFAGDFYTAICLENWPKSSERAELYTERANEMKAGQTLEESLGKYT